MIYSFILFALIFMSFEQGFAATEMTIVENGHPRAVIVLDKKPTKSAQLGAFELQHHIRLITGAALPITRDESEPFPNKTIIKIGGENKDFDSGEFQIIKFNPGKILITGNDSPLYGEVDYHDYKTFPQIASNYKGSLFATYDFLEYYCGVRFYNLDESGTCFKPRKTLKVTVKNRCHVSPLDAFRTFSVHPWGSITNKRDLMLGNFRWRVSSYFGHVNHNQYSIYFAHWAKAKSPTYAKLFKYKNHSMFARGLPDIRQVVDYPVRKEYPNDNDLPSQLCFSSTAAADYYAQEAVTYLHGGTVPGGWRGGKIPHFKGKPFFYPFAGCDAANFCRCEKCRVLFTKNNVSDGFFSFVSDITQRAQNLDKGAGIATFAYLHTYAYPENVKLADNLSVQLCPVIYSWWNPIARKLQMEQYKKWVSREASKRPITIHTYIFSTAWDASHHYGGYKAFPGLYPYHMAEITKMFVKDGVRGCAVESEYIYCQLEVYLTMKLLYDPSLDSNKIIKKYFTDCFGKAGPVIEEFYNEIEKAYWNEKNCPSSWFKHKNVVMSPKGIRHPYWTTGLWSPELNWTVLGTPERMEKLGKLIDQARLLVSTPAEKQRLKRITDVIWKTALEGRREYQLTKIRKSSPLKLLSASKKRDANGNPNGINWQACESTDVWGDVNGNNLTKDCWARTAFDSEYLYIRLSDIKGCNPKNTPWKDDFEIFISSNGGYPYYQFAWFSNGKHVLYKYEKNNGYRCMVNISTKTIRTKVNNIPKPWDVSLAIPFNLLDIKKRDAIRINFARVSAQRGINLIWNPIFINSLPQGIDRSGILELNPKPIIVSGIKFKASNIVDDPHAGDGKAAIRPSGWGAGVLAYTIPNDFIPGYYQIFVKIRTDVQPDLEIKQNVCLYDTKLRKNIFSTNIYPHTFAGPDYKKIEIGRFYIRPGNKFYIGGCYREKAGDTSMDKSSTMVDHISFIRALKKK